MTNNNKSNSCRKYRDEIMNKHEIETMLILENACLTCDKYDTTICVFWLIVVFVVEYNNATIERLFKLKRNDDNN